MAHPAISDEELRRVISYGGVWEEEWEAAFDAARTEAVIAALEAEGKLVVEPERRHYGSGTASYRDLFLYYEERAVRVSEANRDYLRIPGVRLYVCELYPVATWSASSSERWPSAPGQTLAEMPNRSWPFLSPAELLQAPPGDWSEMIATIDAVVAGHGLSTLGSSELDRSLPFEAEIATFLPECTEGRDPELKIFDALFYWRD